jgi:hypothetical protein
MTEPDRRSRMTDRPMDPNLRISQLQLEHRHNDGTWSPLEPMHHDSAAHDSERSWLHRTIFRCDCGEEVAVTDNGELEDGEEPQR